MDFLAPVCIVLGLVVLVLSAIVFGYLPTFKSKARYDEMTSYTERERQLIKEDREKLSKEIAKLKSELKEQDLITKNQQLEITKRNNALLGMQKHYDAEANTIQHHKNIEIKALLHKYDLMINDYIKARITELSIKNPNYQGAQQTLVDIYELNKAKKGNKINAEQYLDSIKAILDNIETN